MKWFKIEELMRCYRVDDRCKECKLVQRAERAPNGVEENLRALVEVVLDPAREALGKPITVNSGFRCPLHNAAVGGVPNSQHLRGEAADVSAGSPEENQRLGKIIEENGVFDQLIYEKCDAKGRPRWIHVSYKKNGFNRKMVLWK